MSNFDAVLDALDEAPFGRISATDGDGRVIYTGPLATIQWLASRLSVSDGTARKAVHGLRVAGLVAVWDVLDPEINHRRLHVSGMAT